MYNQRNILPGLDSLAFYFVTKMLVQWEMEGTWTDDLEESQDWYFKIFDKCILHLK